MKVKGHVFRCQMKDVFNPITSLQKSNGFHTVDFFELFLFCKDIKAKQILEK